MFSKLFQNLQIRTSSEVRQITFPTHLPSQAMAETVGSVMGNHTGKGRYLTPENFGKELYLGECFGILVTYSDPEFNPGPLFLLHSLAERMFGLRKRDYLYRRKAHNARSPPTSPAWPTTKRVPRWPPSGRSTWTRRTCPSSYGSSSSPAVRRRRPRRYSSDSLLLDI